MKKTKPQLPRLIGVVHLDPTPGSVGALEKASAAPDQLSRLVDQAVSQTKTLTKAGFDGIVIENFGDTPFVKTQVNPETTASMAIIAAVIRDAAPKAKLGINVLRNDARTALAIAGVVGLDFIRVNILSGVAATDQGIIEADPISVLRFRQSFCPWVKILADAHVKHARSLSSHSLELQMEELVLRARADALIITGETTGREVDPGQLSEASDCAKRLGVPLYIGSGATAANAKALLKKAHGLIVGSSLRKNGRAGTVLDTSRIKKFIQNT